MRGGLSRWGLAWRGGASLVILASIIDGTWHGRDERWPFAPMSQFAFAVNNSGEIRSRFVEAVTVEGRLVFVPLSPNGLGIERAEVEGQLPRFVREPELLQAIAVAHARRQPDQPRYAVLYLRERVTHLDQGRATGVTVDTLASWTVPDPAEPKEIP